MQYLPHDRKAANLRKESRVTDRKEGLAIPLGMPNISYLAAIRGNHTIPKKCEVCTKGRQSRARNYDALFPLPPSSRTSLAWQLFHLTVACLRRCPSR